MFDSNEIMPNGLTRLQYATFLDVSGDLDKEHEAVENSKILAEAVKALLASLPKPEARPEGEGLRAALEQAIAVYTIGRDLSWRLQGFEGVCTDKEAPWVIQARAALRSPGAGAE